MLTSIKTDLSPSKNSGPFRILSSQITFILHVSCIWPCDAVGEKYFWKLPLKDFQDINNYYFTVFLVTFWFLIIFQCDCFHNLIMTFQGGIPEKRKKETSGHKEEFSFPLWLKAKGLLTETDLIVFYYLFPIAEMIEILHSLGLINLNRVHFLVILQT